MTEWKKCIVRRIEQNARQRMAMLANNYLQAKPEEREEIQAGIEIERWLAGTCRECLE